MDEEQRDRSSNAVFRCITRPYFLYLKSINQCFTSIKRLTSDFFLICISKFIQCVGAAAIKTMGADLALWQTYGCYKLLDGVELQCG